MSMGEIRKVHLVGIGGTAMAALAAMLLEKGIAVTGSDQALYPPMSDFLAQRGIPVRGGFCAGNLDPDIDFAIIGNAVSRGNEEVEAVLERRIPYRSMPEVLRTLFLEGKKPLVVAGTHGKTTTASILSWVLLQAGCDPSFLVGGIPRGLGAGYRLGQGDPFVVEGDEYDSAFFDKRPKFLHYTPWIVTLGAIEFDHADIYRDLEHMLGAYRMLFRVLPRCGRLVVNADDPLVRELAQESPCPVVTCSLNSKARWAADQIRVQKGRTHFRVLHGGAVVGECSWSLVGRHNVLNGLLALAAAHEAGLQAEVGLGALVTFQGVKRRLELVGEAGGILIYDDFAHHPTAVRAGLVALRELHPEARIWAILEPRSNSMCRSVFQGELPSAFLAADRVVVAGVHRAERIPPRERLDPEALVQAIQELGPKAWYIPRVDQIVDWLKGEVLPGDVICIMSNGAFGGIHGLLMEALATRSHGHCGSRKSTPLSVGRSS